jgi:uroporphyrin-III C-methyltransferase / precorrin-2 dehydrogenase / sirohydrochlorin ferrochelatase
LLAPVTIVDIGEDADTLTLGAIRLLRAADDIFFDEAVPAAATDFARREARRHAVSAGRTDSQAVTDALIQAVATGGRVVRLRLRTGSETIPDVAEADALRSAGIPVIVVPRGPPS